MADGRFVARSIAHDLKLNSVSLEADYLFTRCIPHLDREGRMKGHPREVKAVAVPIREEMGLEVVDRCLGELARAGLVVWYAADGRACLWFPGFEANQKGLRKDTYQVLTKRPGRALRYLTELGTRRGYDRLEEAARGFGYTLRFEGVPLDRRAVARRSGEQRLEVFLHPDDVREFLDYKAEARSYDVAIWTYRQTVDQVPATLLLGAPESDPRNQLEPPLSASSHSARRGKGDLASEGLDLTGPESGEQP